MDNPRRATNIIVSTSLEKSCRFTSKSRVRRLKASCITASHSVCEHHCLRIWSILPQTQHPTQTENPRGQVQQWLHGKSHAFESALRIDFSQQSTWLLTVLPQLLSQRDTSCSTTSDGNYSTLPSGPHVLQKRLFGPTVSKRGCEVNLESTINVGRASSGNLDVLCFI